MFFLSTLSVLSVLSVMCAMLFMLVLSRSFRELDLCFGKLAFRRRADNLAVHPQAFPPLELLPRGAPGWWRGRDVWMVELTVSCLRLVSFL